MQNRAKITDLLAAKSLPQGISDSVISNEIQIRGMFCLYLITESEILGSRDLADRSRDNKYCRDLQILYYIKNTQ
jgi:hypothetical protein